MKVSRYVRSPESLVQDIGWDCDMASTSYSSHSSESLLAVASVSGNFYSALLWNSTSAMIKSISFSYTGLSASRCGMPRYSSEPNGLEFTVRIEDKSCMG